MDLRQSSLCTGPSLCKWHRIVQTCLRPPASILCTGQCIHEFRLVIPFILCTGHRFLKFPAGFCNLLSRTYDSRHSRCHYAQGTGWIEGVPIYHFLLIPCTGHRIHKFRAGLLSYEHAPGSATVVVIMHRAPDCANLYPPTCVNSMLRALGS